MRIHNKLRVSLTSSSSHADVLRLVTRSSSRGEERVTSLKTSGAEATLAPVLIFFSLISTTSPMVGRYRKISFAGRLLELAEG